MRFFLVVFDFILVLFKLCFNFVEGPIHREIHVMASLAGIEKTVILGQ